MRKGAGTAIVGASAVAVVAAVGYGVLTGNGPLSPASDECTATVDGHSVDLTLEQAENAALITAISIRRGLPARAASIALATAYQESDLYNIDYGDRDSLGLFQQRPSQGWGSEEQVLDPVYATNAFYDALAEVNDYEGLEITVAAQEVQRSGFPDAYADHEQDARTIASALTGNSPEAFSCEIDDDVDSADTTLLDTGLTDRADVVRREALGMFGDLALGGFAPGGVSSGHIEGSAHYEGRAVDIFFRPVNAENQKSGWAVAHYLMAQSDRLDIKTIIFDDRIWTVSRSDQGWRDYDAPSGSGDPVILEHRDHVHVDVVE
ncbi:hypothetical protein NPS01_40430 [Nocardioides psychrotolerans]|uniref:ARB-07466-like C-terminal domain-containing protein n=1 Tax=Nocardioides psychrotolerans TaxID=1005945 RepID=A0A1I3IWF6_9ACTN|nr:hypothetical protein [Nocardioides psychrotolerans]GEP40380.1 hypothetical protein NPS01_40430 [Nocardioides psychrotolerans]SFI52205.1 hypothetical protein SAMN05216561_109167 [Nocardioides psychrotolerans]